MQLSHLGHATILVASERARILIDPGALDDAWHGLEDLDVVLVTHQHPDHVDPEHLPALLAANPRAQLVMPADALTVVDPPGARIAAPGDHLEIADVRIEAVGGVHAVIHADIPLVDNLGYVLHLPGGLTFFHPGDALDAVPAGVDLLALPIMGPWSAMKEQVEFVRALGSPRSVIIHDALLSPAGRALLQRQIGRLAGAEILDLREAGPLAL